MPMQLAPATQNTLRRWCLAASVLAAAVAPALSQAATVTHRYTQLDSNTWSADFAVVNDGSPASFAGFTVFFASGSFSNLAVTATPSTWDSLVIQPDAALPAAGYFDTTVLSASGPSIGQTQTGFTVKFDWSGVGANPGALPFTLNDAYFAPLAAGMTTPVPEPASALLLTLGAATLLSLHRLQRRTESI